MSDFRYAVDVLPKPGILDPQGRAVEGALPHLGIDSVRAIRVGRHVELTATADDEPAARAIVERLAGELLSNPLIETFSLTLLEATSSAASTGAAAAGGATTPSGAAGR